MLARSVNTTWNANGFECEAIQVWRAYLDQTRSQVDSLHRLLSPDEKIRASRFCFRRDRDRYVAARGTLRRILGRYLDIEPGCLEFRYGSYGKPALVLESGGDILHFNLSHSDGVAIFALSGQAELGIDLELIRADFATLEIAERFFSLGEVAALRGLPTELRVKAFFNCWTRKEAYLKARGEGLSFPLDRFQVSLLPGEPALLLQTEDDPREAQRWVLHDLNLDGGFVGALAVEAHPVPSEVATLRERISLL